MRMKLLYYNCTFALFIIRLHKLGIEAHAYAHYTCLLCFALLYVSFGHFGFAINRKLINIYNLFYFRVFCLS